MKITLYIVVRCQNGDVADVDVFLSQEAAETAAEGYREACDFEEEIDAVEVLEREIEIPGALNHRIF